MIDKSSKIQSGGADNCGHLGAVGNECKTSGTGMWSGACAGAGEGHSGVAGLCVLIHVAEHDAFCRYLDRNSLTGTIPAEALGNLTSLLDL